MSDQDNDMGDYDEDDEEEDDTDLYHDSIGRCYCKTHRREQCQDCGYHFDLVNRNMEYIAGMKKGPTRIKKLAYEKVIVEAGRAEFATYSPEQMEKLKVIVERQKEDLIRVDQQLEELRRQGKGNEIDFALRKELDKAQTKKVERNAWMQAMSRNNPHVNVFEWGSPGTQQVFDQYAALPPSAQLNSLLLDPFACSFCDKVSNTKFQCCSRCKKQAYCSKSCQKIHWKAHKKECSLVEASTQVQDVRTLPLTWEQLEAFQVAPSHRLEVRFLEQKPGEYLTVYCKDRVGICKRVEAHTHSRLIPGYGPGKIMV
jgi:hypothetical protein